MWDWFLRLQKWLPDLLFEVTSRMSAPPGPLGGAGRGAPGPSCWPSGARGRGLGASSSTSVAGYTREPRNKLVIYTMLSFLCVPFIRVDISNIWYLCHHVQVSSYACLNKAGCHACIVNYSPCYRCCTVHVAFHSWLFSKSSGGRCTWISLY